MSTDETMALADLYYHNPYRAGSHTHLVYADQKRVALLKAVEALAADAARFAWVLPILSGDDDDLANTRALSLATQFLYGTSTRNAIDAAMKETP